MSPLLADFIHIKVCKPNLRKTLDTTGTDAHVLGSSIERGRNFQFFDRLTEHLS